jgi:NAD(P) transhydrogenase subunit alpha
MSNTAIITKYANKLAEDAQKLAEKANELTQDTTVIGGIDPFIFAITIFVLACFVGYYVVWKVTPALHTPLMSVTNAISGIIIVGAIIAVGPGEFELSTIAGFLALIIASVNIFGGFIVTYRMLAMFRKK